MVPSASPTLPSTPSPHQVEKGPSSNTASSPKADDHTVSSGENRGIGVVVRVRPLSTQELANSTLGYCIKCFKDAVIVDGTNSSGGSAAVQRLGTATKYMKPRRFEVDTVHHQHCSQKQVYEESCRHIIEALFDGINGAILAYGATGSGKTHTMFGSAMSAPGIVYEAVHDIFDVKTMLEEEEGKKVKVKCSFIEIYNENVFDLLAPQRKPTYSGVSPGSLSCNVSEGSPLTSISSLTSSAQPKGHNTDDTGEKTGTWVNGRQSLPVLEGATSSGGGINSSGKSGEEKGNPESLHISGLTYVFPESVEEFSLAIEKGRLNRFVASTAANSQSSRSHAIITIEIQISGPPPFSGTIGRIRMCDLAGSERAASSTNSGIRLREGGSINRSLLALGSVVQSLLQQKRKPSQKTFIPYRGSCLTRLLKDSLGGNCRTQMIFCLNPSTRQLEESVNTMLFAMKAKQVQVQVHRNELRLTSAVLAKNQELLIDELRQQISYYQEELRRIGVNLEKESMVKWQAESVVAPLAVKSATNADSQISTTKNGTWMSAAANNSGGNDCGGSVGLHYLNAARQRRQEKNYSAEKVDEELATERETFSQKSILPGHEVVGSVNINGSIAENSSRVSSELEEGGPPTGTIFPRCASLRRRQKPDIVKELSPQFVSLQSSLKTLLAEKESQYWKNREAKERIVARDLQLRELKWKLARFLASNELGVRLRGVPPTTIGGTVPTPVGVAGMRKTIADVEAEQMKECDSIQNMIVDLERTDRKMEALEKEIPKDTKNQILGELLLDNMKLRQSCTEAEHLAAEYHQECRQANGHITEYEEALSVCVSALHSVIPHIPHNAKAMADAQLALFYANLPRAETQDMIKVFEASLKADSTPPLVPTGNNYSSGNGPILDSSCPLSSPLRHPASLKTSNPWEAQQLALRDMQKTFSLIHSTLSRGQLHKNENRATNASQYGDNSCSSAVSPHSTFPLDMGMLDSPGASLSEDNTEDIKVEDEEEEEPSPLCQPPPPPHPLIHYSYSSRSDVSRSSSDNQTNVSDDNEKEEELRESKTTIRLFSSFEKLTNELDSKVELDSLVSEATEVEDSQSDEEENASVAQPSASITRTIIEQPPHLGITKIVKQNAKATSIGGVPAVKKTSTKEKGAPQKLGRLREKAYPNLAFAPTVKPESITSSSDHGGNKKENECHLSYPSLVSQSGAAEKNFLENNKKYSNLKKPAPFTRCYSSVTHSSKNSSPQESPTPPPHPSGSSVEGGLHYSLLSSTTPSHQQDDYNALSQGKEGGLQGGCRRRNTGVGAGVRKGNVPVPTAETKSSEMSGARTAGASGKCAGGKLLEATSSSLPKTGMGKIALCSSFPFIPLSPTKVLKAGPHGGKRNAQESATMITQSPPQHVEADVDPVLIYARTPSRVSLPLRSASRPPTAQEIVKSSFKAHGNGLSGGVAIRLLTPRDPPVLAHARKREDGCDQRPVPASVGSSASIPSPSSPSATGTDARSMPSLSSSAPMKRAATLAPSLMTKVGAIAETSSPSSSVGKPIKKRTLVWPKLAAGESEIKVVPPAETRSASKTTAMLPPNGHQSSDVPSTCSFTLRPSVGTPRGRSGLSDIFWDDVEVSRSTLMTDVDDLSSSISNSSLPNSIV